MPDGTSLESSLPTELLGFRFKGTNLKENVKRRKRYYIHNSGVVVLQGEVRAVLVSAEPACHLVRKLLHVQAHLANLQCLALRTSVSPRRC